MEIQMKLYSQNRISYILTLAALGCAGFSAPAFGQVINEDIKIIPSDGSIIANFGSAVDIDGDQVVIGARSDGAVLGTPTGAAYIFDVPTTSELLKLQASDGFSEDRFGTSLGIDAGVVVVGAFLEDDNGLSAGAAYLFNASTGAEMLRLDAGDTAAADFFGWAVAIDDGLVVVSAYGDDDNGAESGSIYVFSATTGVFMFKLSPDNPIAGEFFGWSVAIEDNTIAVGALLGSNGVDISGAAYLFDATTGDQLFKLLADDGGANDLFGTSIALHNGLVAVGARGDRPNGFDSGSAYVFDTSTGLQVSKLVPDDGAVSDQFGLSISVHQGVVAVTAPLSDGAGSNSGSAYLFNADDGSQIAKLLATDAASDDRFGQSVSMEDGVVAVGAWLDDDNGSGSGSAYLFSVPEEECTADFTGDGTLDIFDLFDFIAAFNSSMPNADLTGDGIFDIFDVFEFIEAFNAGCP
jgi:hypothetical protein